MWKRLLEGMGDHLVETHEEQARVKGEGYGGSHVGPSTCK